MLEGMAANPQNLTTWQAEYGGARRPFSVVLIVFALLAALLLAAAPSDIGERVNEGRPSTLCAEHAGRPGWDAVCPQPHSRSVSNRSKRSRG